MPQDVAISGLIIREASGRTGYRLALSGPYAPRQFLGIRQHDQHTKGCQVSRYVCRAQRPPFRLDPPVGSPSEPDSSPRLVPVQDGQQEGRHHRGRAPGSRARTARTALPRGGRLRRRYPVSRSLRVAPGRRRSPPALPHRPRRKARATPVRRPRPSSPHGWPTPLCSRVLDVAPSMTPPVSQTRRCPNRQDEPLEASPGRVLHPRPSPKISREQLAHNPANANGVAPDCRGSGRSQRLGDRRHRPPLRHIVRAGSRRSW